MKRMQGYLEEHEYLPEGIRFFLTTTKNKEGINILDKNVKIMFAESHSECELIQMAGRVREGLEYLCVLWDAAQHPIVDALFDAELSYRSSEGVLEYWTHYVNTYGQDRSIKEIEKRYGCLRYDVLTSKIRTYAGRKEGLQQIDKDRELFDLYITDWDNGCWIAERNNQSVICCGRDFLQEWFPESKVFLYDEPVDVRAMLAVMIEEYLQMHDYIDVELNKEERKKILQGINRILRPHLKTLKLRHEYTDLKPALRLCEKYEISRTGENKKNLYKISLKEE